MPKRSNYGGAKSLQEKLRKGAFESDVKLTYLKLRGVYGPATEEKK